MATNSIGATGTYSTPQAWEDDLAATLTEAEVGQLENEHFTGGPNQLTISGTTTTASFTITLECESGASFIDDANIETNDLRYNSANGAGIQSTNGYTTTVSISDDYVRLKQLQIQATAGSGTAFLCTGDFLEVEQCIIDTKRNSNSINATQNSTWKSCLLIHSGSAPSVIFTGSPTSGDTVDLYNCTLVVPSDSTAATNAMSLGNNATYTFVNCAFFGCSNVYSGSVTPTFTTCGTDDGSPPSGCSTYTYSSQFQSTTLADKDFRIVTGADLKNAGTTNANGSPSINDRTRPESTSYDIGAWEFVEGGGGGGSTDTSHLLAYHIRQQRKRALWY